MLEEEYVVPVGQQAIIVLIEGGRATQVIMRGRDPIRATADLLDAAKSVADDVSNLIALSAGLERTDEIAVVPETIAAQVVGVPPLAAR